MTAELMEPPNCACFAIRKAARRVTQAYDRALKPAGVTATQFSLLATLDTAGGATMTRLAAALGMDRTTLTRNLGIAERAGWVAASSGHDRRERLVELTPAGRARLQAGLPHWQAAQKRLLQDVGADGLVDLIALSRRLGAT